MSKLALRPCPICTGGETIVLHHQQLQQPSGSPLPTEYDIVACTGCGMVYADTPAPQAAYDRYYAEYSKYEDPAVATGDGENSLDRTRLEQLAARIAASTAATARILDLGCAGGGLLKALRRRGFGSLHGADAAPACVERVRQLGFGATLTSLSELGLVDIGGPYDVIVLSHVLEHVLELRSLMASVVKLLAPGGRIYAETPDAARYADFPFVPYYFFDSEHINHFDCLRLGALGSTAGLEPQSTSCVELEVAPDVLYPACWVWLSRTVNQPLRKLTYEDSLVAAITRYIDASRHAQNFPELEQLAVSGSPVIVWGAGSFAQRLFGGTQLQRCNIVAVVDRDRNKQGLEFSGFVVQAPETALTTQTNAIVVIAAAIHGASIAAEIARGWPDAKSLVLAASSAK
jgi:SAM-dependent methyltransferase